MLYFIERESDKYIKIGITINLHNRLSQLIREYGNMTVLGWIAGYLELEGELHWKFRHLREDGEFFRPEQDLLDYIAEYACTIPYDEWEQALYNLWRESHNQLSFKELESMRNKITELENENLQLKADNTFQAGNFKPASRNTKQVEQEVQPRPTRFGSVSSTRFNDTNKSTRFGVPQRKRYPRFEKDLEPRNDNDFSDHKENVEYLKRLLDLANDKDKAS